MTELRDHFLTLIGDLCQGMEVAGLRVELTTEDGESVTGVPRLGSATSPEHEVDDTGYADTIHVDGRSVPLRSITSACVFWPPDREIA